MLEVANVFSIENVDQKPWKIFKIHVFWQWSEYVCCILASFTLVQRKRKGCDYSLSLACLIGPLIGTPFVCVPPAFHCRHGARWKLAAVHPFVFPSSPLENDPPAGYFIPGRSSLLLLCTVRWCSLSYQSPAAAHRSVARICVILCRVEDAESWSKHRVNMWGNRRNLKNIILQMSGFLPSIWSTFIHQATLNKDIVFRGASSKHSSSVASFSVVASIIPKS